MSEFFTSGAVPIKSPAYIQRSFENEVYREITAGNWVLLLGPRQHGKSTGLVRIRKQLKENGIDAALVDLQGLPPCDTYPQLLWHMFDQLAKSLGQTLSLPSADGQEDFLAWLNQLVPAGLTPFTIIIDEAASIDDSAFRNSLYGQIRQISSLRAEASDTDVAARMRFVFAGTFRPETLVSEQNSPFNVCQTVFTTDLTIDEARHLATNVNQNLNQIVDAAHNFVGGQPFLLQTIFKEVSQPRDTPLEQAFAEVAANLAISVSSHLEGIFSKIISSPALAQKVSEMLQAGSTQLIPADSDSTYLQVIGLARREGQQLVFRNQFYADVARQSPQLQPVPAAAVTGAPVYRLDKAQLDFMNDDALKEIAYSAYGGATILHNSGSYRLALVGFGSAMEAVLIDWLGTMKPSDRDAAIQAAESQSDQSKRPNFQKPYEMRSDPTTWRLINLINVSRAIKVASRGPEPSHALREWRNLIHPANAKNYYVDESKLEPESSMAAAMFAALLRDIQEVRGAAVTGAKV